jgi:hypothetical protein
MNAWSETKRPPLARGPILLVGPDSEVRRALVQELHSLPASTMTALDLDEAIAGRRETRTPPSVLLLPEDLIRPDEFETQLAELRIRSGSPGLVPIALGQTPSAQRRMALRDAGIDLALFGGFGRHALRFQINRALSRWATRRPRGERRAPQEWRTRTFSSGREKAVRCYSLSSGGGYFVTPRPWVVGTDLFLELPMGRERLLVEGRILYTNVSGDGSGRALPRGMAITFRPLFNDLQRFIRNGVSRGQAKLEV